MIALAFIAALSAVAAPPNDEPATAAADAEAAHAKPATRPAVVVTPPPKGKFRLYVLMGQSNMVGRDTRTITQQTDNPRVLALNADGQWVVAHEPMHAKGSGIGPGIPFALEMLKTDPDITIGLVPCAVGSTPLRRWVKGAELYEAAVKRAKLAAGAGTISGVLWHQGEWETTKKANADGYDVRLTQMLQDLRRDLGTPNLPVVVGQLGTFLPEAKYPFAEVVRAAIARVPSKELNIGFADSAGLTDKGDKLHFSADAQKELGARYAKAMLTLDQATGHADRQ